MDQFRQGDVLVTRIRTIPASTRPVAREKGRIVLAHGEVTGHAHAIADRKAELRADENDARFLRVLKDAGLIDSWHIRLERGDAYVPANEDPTSYVGYVETLGREHVAGVILRHEEHKPFVIPTGAHRVTRQREYTPEAIRNVAD